MPLQPFVVVVLKLFWVNHVGRVAMAVTFNANNHQVQSKGITTRQRGYYGRREVWAVFSSLAFLRQREYRMPYQAPLGTADDSV